MTESLYDAFWALLLVPAAVVARRTGPVLVARYDNAALHVAPPVALPVRASTARPHTAWPALLSWCFTGAGDGRSPLWRPWVLPRVGQRFTVALLADAPDVAELAVAEAFCRHIDGSDQLAALHSRAAGITLRVRVKLRDALWWRARQPTDPWDSGHLVDEPAALQALRRFRPRRATLLVALNLSERALRERVTVLAARQAAFAHPVRLLVLGTTATALTWGDVPVTRLLAPVRRMNPLGPPAD